MVRQTAASAGRGPQSPAPSISILLPVFNEPPELIEACMNGVAAQTVHDYECLVLDDSTDEESRRTWDRLAAADARIRILRSDRRLGLVASLNRGLAEARGAYIARVDADDICEPSRLRSQLAFLQDHPEVDLVGCSVKIISEAGAPLGARDYPTSHERIAAGMSLVNTIAHPTVFARKASFDRFGHYDERFRYSEDLELWLRWLRGGARFANLPEPLVTLRFEDTRPQANWRFNLKARARNFDWRRMSQAVGLFGVMIASIVPPGIPRMLWTRLVVRNTPAPSSGAG